MARALSFNGLANAQLIAGINSGSHVNPCISGDTISAWSEVLDSAATSSPNVGAIRLRLVAVKQEYDELELYNADGAYKKNVLLDFDYWALIPI